MLGAAPYTESDNTTIAQELPSEIVPKTIPPEVCDNSQPLPSETVFADNNDSGLKGCKIGDMIKQAKLDGTYKDPYDGINFVEFHPVIKDRDGNVIFDEKVIFPDYFRENDVKIVASKYLANQAKRKETDLRQMIDRVSDTITDWGIKDGYFKTEYDALQYNYKLKYYHIHQYASFNSPVYFNVGLDDSKPQTAACFILSVDDNMESITDWYAHESLLFKGGSGSGVNLSKLRSSKERVRGGGFASGPVSFLKASDTIAGVIRSGGTLRRAAKMACLNIDHPDIMKFISCKDREEKKLRLIKQAGMKPEAGAELSDDIFFQNVNLSARLSNKFMRAVKNNGVWNTTEVLTGKIVDTYDAKGLLMYLSECSWKGGEPGIQFHDNINLMNTVSAEGDIDASNPCGEWNFLNNTVCNLAAHNLLKFFSIVNGVVVFDKAAFVDVIRTITTAQDLFIDNSIYPNDKITKNAKRYRTMGYGFSNLGALFMYLGLPYDSDRAMSLASVLNSLMTGIAYQVSADLARDIGTAEWWDNKKNHESMHNVIHIHRSSTDNINDHNDELIAQIKKSCCDVWADLDDNFRPIRAASTTLSAPTGTTGFLMGCDSFGPEPFFGLITYKTLSGNDGATIKTVSDTVFLALLNLGYSEETANNIISDMTDRDIPIEKSPFVKPEHVPIFDTAVAPVNGVRAIGYMGHVNMLAAIQPFISSAISKTINMDNKCTVKDIYDIYMYSWEKGLKSITIYRDGSKTEQVLTTVETKNEIEPEHTDKPYRKRMPIDRNAKIHKFTINGNVEGYIIAGIYEDGSLGELFIEGTSFGSTLGGFTDSLSIVTSMALQHGVPLDVLVKKLMHTRFEPAGFSTNPNIRVTSSLVDYIFRYLALEFLPDDKLVELGLKHSDDINTTDLSKSSVVSGSPCPVCSSLMVRLGTCEQCLNGCYSSGACG